MSANSQDSVQQGLLAFICWVVNDTPTNHKCHDDPGALISHFKLSVEEGLKILEIGKNHNDPAYQAEIPGFLDKYLTTPFLTIWTAQPSLRISKPAKQPGWIPFMYYARYDRATNQQLLDAPKAALAAFGITDEQGLDYILTIAQAPGSSAARDAAHSIFAQYITPEILGTNYPDKFW